MSDWTPNLRLRRAIVDDGREHRQIAAAAGITGVTLGGVLSGRVPRPSARTRARLAAALGRDEADLFEDAQVTL